MLGGYLIGSRYLGSGRSVAGNPIPISGSANATAQTSLEDLRNSRPLSGTAQAGASSSGATRVRIGLAGLAVAAASTQAALGGRRSVSGSASGMASSQVALGARAPLSGAGTARAVSDGAVGRFMQISGALEARATSQIIISRSRPVSGAAVAEASSSAGLLTAIPLAGAATAVAIMEGQLNLPFFGEEDSGRIIFVRPKFPRLIVEPKRPIIKVIVDDQGIVMEIREKQPSEIVDYVLDMREWFKQVDSQDFIASGEVTVEEFGNPDDLAIGPGTKPDFSPIGEEPRMARIWVGGGRDGIEYKLTARVTTNEGRLEEVDILVIVREG